jgi:hypothetical protein
MKDVCLCIIKSEDIDYKVHSIGINNGEGKYCSEEGGGCFDLSRNTNIFEYKELTWQEFRLLVSGAFTKQSLKDAYIQGYRKRAIMSGLKYDSISELNAKTEFENWYINLYGV